MVSVAVSIGSRKSTAFIPRIPGNRAVCRRFYGMAPYFGPSHRCLTSACSGRALVQVLCARRLPLQVRRVWCEWKERLIGGAIRQAAGAECRCGQPSGYLPCSPVADLTSGRHQSCRPHFNFALVPWSEFGNLTAGSFWVGWPGRSRRTVRTSRCVPMSARAAMPTIVRNFVSPRSLLPIGYQCGAGPPRRSFLSDCTAVLW